MPNATHGLSSLPRGREAGAWLEGDVAWSLFPTCSKSEQARAEEVARRLRALVALTEDLRSIPSTW